MKNLVSSSIIFLLFLFTYSIWVGDSITTEEQPLSKIAIHKAVYAWRDSSSITAFPSIVGTRVINQPFLLSLFQIYFYNLVAYMSISILFSFSALLLYVYIIFSALVDFTKIYICYPLTLRRFDLFVC